MEYHHELFYLILTILLSFGHISHQQQIPADNQNYLNYNQAAPQGRFLSSYSQNSRNGFFPIRQQSNQQSAGSYQSQELFVDNLDSRFSSFQQQYPTTRTPNIFEISPRPFTVTTSPLQNRGIAQFNDYGGRDNFQFQNFPSSSPSAGGQRQRQNPYLSSPGFQQLPNLESISDRPSFGRNRGSFLRETAADDEVINSSIELKKLNQNYFNPSHSNRLNRNNFNVRNRDSGSKEVTGTITTSTTTTSTRRPISAFTSEELFTRRNRYSPVTRSTTKKTPQPSSAESYEYSDQKYSFTRKNKVKSQQEENLYVKPLNEYNVNISHGNNDLSVKSLNSFKKEQKTTPEPEYEYEYDDDYDGLILTEEDRAIKEQSKVATTPKTTTPATTTTTTTRTTLTTTTPTTTTSLTTEALKPDDHTVIITDNFFLPKKSSDDEEEEEDDEDDVIEYIEYIDDDEEEPGKTTQNTIVDSRESGQKKPVDDYEIEIEEEADNDNDHKNKNILSEAVVSVVTSKTVVNGTIMDSQEKDKEYEETSDEVIPKSENIKPTTENYVVVASVQTSRSVSGAHFLPFPHVEQDERKQTISELNGKKPSNVEEDSEEILSTEKPQIPTSLSSTEVDDDENVSGDYHTTIPITSTTKNAQLPLQSTESIIDKLDRVQSELSLGILSGEYPVLLEASTTTPHSTIQTSTSIEEEEEEPEPSTTSRPLVFIRKFSPKSTTVKISTTRPPLFTLPTRTTQENTPSIETSSATTQTTSTTTTATSEQPKRENKKGLFGSIGDDELDSLLPAGYKNSFSYKGKKFTTTTTTTTESSPSLETEDKNNNELKDGIKIDRNNTGRSFKSQINSQDLSGGNKFKKFNKNEENDTKKLSKVAEDSVDISKLLPPGFKLDASSEKPLSVIPLAVDNIGKFLPPDYKKSLDSSASSTTTKEPVIKAADDISKFLPPGYKSPTESSEIKVVDDISALLPAGYKPSATEDEKESKPDVISLFDKIQVKDIANLLPPGYKPEEEAEATSTTTTTTTAKPEGGLKGVVFPSRPGKKPGNGPTKPKSRGPPPPEIKIHKGPITRATTEFTGWPTVSTTPFSIEKYLEMQKSAGAVEIDVNDILVGFSTQPSTSRSTTTRTTTTTTTTTTTPKPTQPTVCRSECNLAGTIRIVQGIEWTNELLDHNTQEWKDAAQKVERELNEVFSRSDALKQWYKKVTIDSFSRGSVLVDYFVELTNVQSDVNTLEIRNMFHDSMVPAPVDNSSEVNQDDIDPSAMPQTKEAFMMGNLLVDPVSTDFIVIPKQVTPATDFSEEDNLLPQWAIAMISMGFLSLLFVVLFGVTVLVNRKKAAKKKAPIPLTADMLNELNKNHMGGLENYGADDLCNLDDTWDERRQEPIKPKRFSNSVQGSNPNIYDSWRSQHHHQPSQPRFVEEDDDFYNYDSHDPYNDPHPKMYLQHPYAGSNRYLNQQYMMQQQAENMYPYSGSNYSNSRKYYRDYDPNF